MSAPTLTAILCNYNHAGYLRQALESYAIQRPWPNQLIVVDDASTDESRGIIEEFVERHPWVEAVWQERNQGWHAGTQRALTRATGDYIYNGAADDYLLPGFFAAAMEQAERHPEAGVLCGVIRRIGPDDEPLGNVGWESLAGTQFVPPAKWRDDILSSGSPWTTLSPTTILKRQGVLDAGGYRAELNFWADSFVIRVLGFQTGLVYLDRECTCFRVMPGSISGTAGSSPATLLQVRREALRLMRSPEFQPAFPTRHVRRWEAETLRMIDATCGEPIDRHYQRILESLDEAARVSGGWRAGLLWCHRKLLSAQVRLIRRLVGRQLRRAAERSLP